MQSEKINSNWVGLDWMTDLEIFNAISDTLVRSPSMPNSPKIWTSMMLTSYDNLKAIYYSDQVERGDNMIKFTCGEANTTEIARENKGEPIKTLFLCF